MVPVSGNGGYDSDPYTPLAAGTYRWIANYGGDDNNEPTANDCNASKENVDVINPSIVITKDVDKPVVHSGDQVTYTIKVQNTGDAADARVGLG